ncbi:MAG: hypothetical protein HYW47_04735 [Deltaproteobacteria bacterium]|nr:hypothetical protein [Deltaproteobacteria bacterium]
MKKLILGLISFLLIQPIFAADLSSGKFFQEHVITLQNGESVKFVATTGEYKAHWKGTLVNLIQVNEGRFDTLYVVDQEPLFHPMVVPSWEPRMFEDKAEVVLTVPANDFKVIKILVPNNLQVFLQEIHEVAIDPVVLEPQPLLP